MRNPGLIRFMSSVMTGVALLVFSALVYAEADLDDVTMRVIGLDEIPTHSLQIIELPQADLGELADINESLVPGAAESPVSPAEGLADTLERAPSPDDAVTSEPSPGN